MIKRFKDFGLNESGIPETELPGLIVIEDFLLEIGIEQKLIPQISEWWNENRKGISIHYFEFGSQDPIIGVYLGENKVCINKKSRDLPDFKLFIAIHESFHCDQDIRGEMEKYFDLVKYGDVTEFSNYYRNIEKEANDFAISSMRELGFSRFIDSSERRLRGNEFAGPQVFSMMRRDIQKTGAETFKDLLLIQILGL
jgi:hypothetical protein